MHDLFARKVPGHTGAVSRHVHDIAWDRCFVAVLLLAMEDDVPAIAVGLSTSREYGPEIGNPALVRAVNTIAVDQDRDLFSAIHGWFAKCLDTIDATAPHYELCADNEFPSRP